MGRPWLSLMEDAAELYVRSRQCRWRRNNHESKSTGRCAVSKDRGHLSGRMQEELSTCRRPTA